MAGDHAHERRSNAVAGFDHLERRWVTAADAATSPCADAPTLDGELAIDDASREAVATDLGAIARHKPCAVLRPGSAGDIAAMIRFCRAHQIAVSPRGEAHTTLGQCLSDGLVIETRHLNRIHSLGPHRAEVDAGIHWMDLANAAYAESPRATPPVLTAYTGLTVGGTLSVGGIGGLVGGLSTGLQVDHVHELEVVTGTGEIERCSCEDKPELFETILGGLGQCGVITKAAIELVPVKEHARTYALSYDDNATFFRDLRNLLDRPDVDHIYAELFPPGTSLTYKIYATVFYDESAPPADEGIVSGLSVEPDVEDTGYLDYVFSIDNGIAALREMVDWDRLLKPWLDVWLPGSTAEAYLAELLPSLDPLRDIGSYGAGLLYPQRRERTTRPYPSLPQPDGSPWVFVLDINTVSPGPGPDPEFVAEMLARNERLFARARDAYGAVLYPIGSVRFAAQDWRIHYGDAWPDFRAAKRRYDPDGVLTPGPGIFERA